jgi:hypothetical protein
MYLLFVLLLGIGLGILIWDGDLRDRIEAWVLAAVASGVVFYEQILDIFGRVF